MKVQSVYALKPAGRIHFPDYDPDELQEIEAAIVNQANRLSDDTDITDEELMTLEPEDVPGVGM
ncbi:MAG: hypothetical protein LBR77_07290 [Lachnospiraceae bacterium]|nr:hypothetical protein [Lachnospiraceae bacterium]